MRSVLMRWIFLATMWVNGQAAANQVLVLGDSLSAAHNLAVEEGWVHLLEQHLRLSDAGSKVYNASISGETSAGGAERIEGLLAEHPEATVLILELGANDGLRGLSLEQTRTHLEQILRAAHGRSMRVLLIGIELPVNYGRRYRDGLRALYADLAKQAHGFVPHLLQALGTDLSDFQADGLHPVASAQPRILATVLAQWPEPGPTTAKAADR